MELDGDEVAITYIKDVTFNANRPDVEVLKMTKVHSSSPTITFHSAEVHWYTGRPQTLTVCTFISSQPPFVMDKWIIGISDKQTVDCIISYEVNTIHKACWEHNSSLYNVC